MYSLWKGCTPGYFTGYDPPRTLNPAAAMVPKETPPSDPNPHPRPATPAATQGSLPVRTTTSADPTKTLSDPSIVKSYGSGDMQEDPSQKTEPSRDMNKAPADPSSNNQDKKQLQEQSPHEDPTPSDPKNGPINYTPSNNAANSDLDQPIKSVHTSKGPSMEDGDRIYQPQLLATSAPAFMTPVSGGHYVPAAVEGNGIDGVDIKPDSSASNANEQQITIDSSRDLQVGGQTAHHEPVIYLVATTIASPVFSPLSKGVAIQVFALKDGGPATVIGTTTISGGNMFIDGHSYRINSASPVPRKMNGEVEIALPEGTSILSATLTPSEPALVISGTSYSLDLSSTLPFSGSSYVSPVNIADVDPTRVTTRAGQLVVELAASISIAGAKPTAGASAIQDRFSASVAIPVRKKSSSASLSKLISERLSSQGSRTTDGIATAGKYRNTSLLTFTGGSEGRKLDISILLSLLIGAWTVIVL